MLLDTTFCSPSANIWQNITSSNIYTIARSNASISALFIKWNKSSLDQIAAGEAQVSVTQHREKRILQHNVCIEKILIYVMQNTTK